MLSGRTMRRVALVIAALVVVAMVGLAGVAISFVQRPTPEVSGEVSLTGMSAPVTVARDASGVPHLTGTSMTDLMRAQGYVHAQDRMFDMDLRRHIASGTLSELVGEAGLPSDRVVRTMGWRQVAQDSLPLLNADTRRYLQAYADGVNDYIRSRSSTRLALEYAVLGLTGPVHAVEDWTPADSLVWLTAMAWDLRGNYSDELARARLTGRVDPLQILQLYPGYDAEEHAPILGADAWQPAIPGSPSTSAAPAHLPTDAEPWYAALSAALDAVPALYGRGEGVGSNSWVVSGEHTASGKPLMANDPHLATRLPGIWYQNSLRCAEVTPECPLQVSGFSLPGLPGVVIGHNDRISWAMTNLGPDVTDFYLERVDEAGRVLRDGEWVDLVSRTETITVAGGTSETLTVRSTVHGPLISDVIPAVADGGAHAPVVTEEVAGDGGRGRVHAMSLAWTGLAPSKTADAIFGINLASNFEEFRTALRDFAVPSQNMLYADVDGHIGYQAPGQIPIRKALAEGEHPGFWPAPGWDSTYDWTDYAYFEQMPWALDPPGGVIVAANQAVTASGGPFLTSEWDHGYRSERIGDLLGDVPDGGFTAADMGTLQRDTLDTFAPRLVAALLEIDLSEDPFTAQARELLRDWDHTTPATGEGAAAAAYFNAVWSHLLSLTFSDELPDDLAPKGGARWRAVIDTLLNDEHNPWWDDLDTRGVTESRTAMLHQALVDARFELTRDLGKEPRDWEWGRLHTWTPTHLALGGDDVPGIVRSYVNGSPVPLGGSGSIVDANGWDASRGYEVNWAPSMRMVVDLADLDGSLWINQTGASGHPASPHYTDQLDDWAAGRLRPWPFTASAIEEATKDTLLLTPSE